MDGGRLSIKVKLALSFVAIVILLIFSVFLANAVQRNSASRAQALVEQNQLNLYVLTIKAEIAESMFPAHDYLIERKPDEFDDFEAQVKRLHKKFKKLIRTSKPGSRERRLVDEAETQFGHLESIQREIFALKGRQIDKLGATKMEKMHVYQQAILDKFDDLDTIKQAELKTFLTKRQTSSRRSITLIALAATLALGTALLVGYLSSE